MKLTIIMKLLIINDLMNNLDSRERAYRHWLAHEIRTPLAVLRAQIEALQDGVHEANDQTLAILHSQVLQLSHAMNIRDANEAESRNA